MKRFVMIAMLTVAFSSVAFAGEIPTDGIPAPHGSGPTVITTTPGEIPMVSPAAELSDVALSALTAVFGWLSA